MESVTPAFSKSMRLFTESVLVQHNVQTVVWTTRMPLVKDSSVMKVSIGYVMLSRSTLLFLALVVA